MGTGPRLPRLLGAGPNDFLYDNKLKINRVKRFCSVFIISRKDAPVCVIDKNDRKSKQNVKKAFKISFGGQCIL